MSEYSIWWMTFIVKLKEKRYLLDGVGLLILGSVGNIKELYWFVWQKDSHHPFLLVNGYCGQRHTVKSNRIEHLCFVVMDDDDLFGWRTISQVNVFAIVIESHAPYVPVIIIDAWRWVQNLICCSTCVVSPTIKSHMWFAVVNKEKFLDSPLETRLYAVR